MQGMEKVQKVQKAGGSERTAQIKEGASYLPAAEVLKEKVQGRSPHHRGGHDAEEW